MRFLFTTLQHIESDFYGRVGEALRDRGHDVAHITYSRQAATDLRAAGFTAYCLPDEMARIDPATDWRGEARLAAERYDTPTFRDIYRTDFVCDGRPEAWCVERTVRHLIATERIFEEWRPDIIVPEVGNETIRTAAHLVGVARTNPVLFLFYTIFPEPLRLYVDTMHGPIAPPEELRPLSEEERASVRGFAREFVERDQPIREYRVNAVRGHQVRMLARHVRVKLSSDRDNDYLRPIQWTLGRLREGIRARVAGALYERRGSDRPNVYFPLHVVEDYKLKRLIPDCADQTAIVQQVARALPHGYDLVVKEHPMSIGRNRLGMLLRLRRMHNVRLLPPHTSSHDLIACSEAVVVISSTAGLEALLHGKPVLTMGRPFYAGFGVTRDLDGPANIREAIPALLDDEPDRERIEQFLHAARGKCYPGAPVLVDDSDENSATLARSLEAVGADNLARRSRRPAARRSGSGNGVVSEFGR